MRSIHLHAKRYFDSFDAVKDEQPQAMIKIYECGGIFDRGTRAIVVEDADPSSAFIIHERFRFAKRVEIASEAVIANGLEYLPAALWVSHLDAARREFGHLVFKRQPFLDVLSHESPG